MASDWVWARDYLDHLKVPMYLNSVRNRIETDPNLFQNLIERYFFSSFQNIVYMEPEPEFIERKSEEEKQLTASIIQSLNEQTIEQLKFEENELQKLQDMTPDLSVLPEVVRSDIPIEPEEVQINSVPQMKSIQSITAETNGIAYFRYLFKAPLILPQDLFLFNFYYGSLGTEHYDYERFFHLSKLFCGFLRNSLQIVTDPYQDTDPTLLFMVSGSSLRRNIPKMTELLNELIQPKFENIEKAQSLFGQLRTNKMQSLLKNTLSYCVSRASRGLTIQSTFKDQFSGIKHLQHLQSIKPEEMEGILEQCNETSKSVRTQFERGLITADTETLDLCYSHIEPFLNLVDTSPVSSSRTSCVHDNKQSAQKEFVVLPLQVNHSAMCLKTVAKMHPDAPALAVLATVISKHYLHKQIREKGGAYGAGAQQSAGIFTFYSYRDPSCESTIHTFTSSIDWAIHNMTEEMISEALLCIFSDYDSPVSPSSKGLDIFIDGFTFEMDKQLRQRFLELSVEDVIEATDRKSVV